MEHKTIICNPENFDEEFKKWINSLDTSNNMYLSKLEIKHDLNSHYILYKMKYDDWGED